ncbi:MAG TPA: hypothetical protein VFJ87_03025 [Rhodanobacteraceae bacterium]|jgi:hypothetical protein|nr:hypothetical protein [Rhodanobacteraceae bacterium]
MIPAIGWKRWLGPGLWLALALPPVRHVLEASMTLQMLVQIPLLAVAGGLSWPWLPRRARDWLDGWNRSGISGIVLVSLVAMVWMLPRSMDAALEVAWVELAKFTSVPLLIGLPLALSWPRAGFVVRGVFLAEVIATAFRMGWLYLVSPVRLCSNYLIGDQRLLGDCLLAIGALTVLLLVWKLMWGRVDIGSLGRRDRPVGDG